MQPLLRSLYHQMPPQARSLAASLRGWYLQRLRYGPETEVIVQSAIEREFWPVERLQGWQQERLSAVLERAAKRVPYYREQWAKRARQGDKRSPQYIENWPLLDKDAVRQNPTAFLADDCDARRMYKEVTSGSTGKPVTLFFSRAAIRTLYALFEARVRRWHGVSVRDRWAIVGGQLVTPFSQTKPPFWAWNAFGKQLYLSSYHLKPSLISHYAEALRRYQVQYLYGYTSSLYSIARELRPGDIQKLTVVFTNAEPMSGHQREVIARAFGCPVVETYGMCEAIAFANECPAGSMHEWPEAGWTEILEDENSSAGDGELISTGLLNPEMPLIRYRVGDRAHRSSRHESCSCGRNLRVFGPVAGRMDDVLYSVDGRAVSRLDPMFKGDLPLREAQIIQEDLALVRLRFVPDAGFNDEHGRALIRGLQDRMGAIEVVLERIDEIPRGANGKFKGVVCNLNRDKIRELRESNGAALSATGLAS